MKKNHTLKFININSEIAAGTRGASLGFGALQTASYNRGSRFFGEHEVQRVTDENHLLAQDTPFRNGLRIDGVARVLGRVCDAVADNLLNGRRAAVLAGDHSTAAGSICGIKKAFPEKRLGVIWIDAHGDLHTPYTTPTGNMHGMPLAMAAGIDNRENPSEQLPTPDKNTAALWEEIKNIGTKGAKIDLKDLVFIALRDTEQPEDVLIEKHGIRNFSVEEVRRLGARSTAEQAIAHLADCDIIYVSFDVDSMDSEISMGTGTPVPNGLTVEEAKDINCALAASQKVILWEMVEVNPTLDNRNRMAEVAFGILEEVAAEIEKKESEAGLP
ncbi:MAG: arginase [Cytophagales bacterium]|nr:arginase [Cytophagales bacterium]